MCVCEPMSCTRAGLYQQWHPSPFPRNKESWKPFPRIRIVWKRISLPPPYFVPLQREIESGYRLWVIGYRSRQASPRQPNPQSIINKH